MHAVQNLLGRKRADLGRFVEWVADFQRSYLLDEFFEKIVVNPVGDKKSFRRDARLTGVNHARFHGRAHRQSKIGAWHDDERVAAAELEHALLNFPGRRDAYRATGFFAASERHGFNSRIDNQSFDSIG